MPPSHASHKDARTGSLGSRGILYKKAKGDRGPDAPASIAARAASSGGGWWRLHNFDPGFRKPKLPVFLQSFDPMKEGKPAFNLKPLAFN